MNYSLNVCHLYPDLMDTYGDRGNIIAIKKRCEWRGIKVKVTGTSIGTALSASDFDLFFFGGGQDRQQEIVGKDLQKKAQNLKAAIEKGAALLSICGGYQLLQNYFKTIEDTQIKGIGIFDAYTQGSTTRMIQNLLIEINPALTQEVSSAYSTISSLSLRGAKRRGNLDSNQDSYASLGMTIETIAKKLQLKIMKTPTGDEQVEDHALYFHPKDYSKQIIQKDVLKLT